MLPSGSRNQASRRPPLVEMPSSDLEPRKVVLFEPDAAGAEFVDSQSHVAYLPRCERVLCVTRGGPLIDLQKGATAAPVNYVRIRRGRVRVVEAESYAVERFGPGQSVVGTMAMIRASVSMASLLLA